MHVQYDFIPQDVSQEQKYRSDVTSYAGKLLEIVGCHTLVVGVDEMDKPFVLACPARLRDVLDELNYTCE